MNESISGVPAEQVGRVVQDFIDDGAKQVTAELMADGTYVVAAIT
jgi:hypothetical protein